MNTLNQYLFDVLPTNHPARRDPKPNASVQDPSFLKLLASYEGVADEDNDSLTYDNDM